MCEIVQFRDAAPARYARAVSRMDELARRFGGGQPTQEMIDGLVAAERETDRNTLTLVNMGLSAPEIARIGREYVS